MERQTVSLSAHTDHTTPRRAYQRAASWLAAASAAAAITCGCAAGPNTKPDPGVSSLSGANTGGSDDPSAVDHEMMAAQPPPTSPTDNTAEVSAHPSAMQPPREEQHTITRRELVAFLDQGIPQTLQQIPMQPVFEKGNLLGYRVEVLFPDRPELAASAGIRVGDVIRRVNGLAVQRPEDLWSVWEGLRKSDRFSVEVVRAGQPLHLIWSVEGGAPGL
jgi:hypothetical protein